MTIFYADSCNCGDVPRFAGGSHPEFYDGECIRHNLQWIGRYFQRAAADFQDSSGNRGASRSAQREYTEAVASI